MNLVRFQQPRMVYSVNSILNDFFNDRSYVAGRSMDNNYPAVNIAETDNAFELEFLAPGFEKENFSITNNKGILTVKGSLNEQSESTEKYTRKRFSIHAFERSFNLPEGILTDEISARYHNGILKVELPKKVDAVQNAELTIPVQ
ncbi:MAG: Hsp20/alpha crystallin family protein [Prolixibacteraceae bacterium]|nr:Hsp20/alpha crystallin family protein [Prolixibacteraceae bacterium]